MMRDLMDEISDLIYVVDLDTYNLEYINLAGRQRFGIEDLKGRKCYETLHGRSQPCEFCNNSRLSEEVYLTWTCDNQKVGRHYLLKDSLIQWNGRKAKVEIACDITEQERQNEELRELLSGQSMILDCVRLLHSADHILQALDDVTGKIGRYVRAGRVCIYEYCPEEGVERAHLWYSSGMPVQDREDVAREECGLAWRQQAFFKENDCVTVPDIRSIESRYPEEYRMLCSKGITSLMTAPLELDRHCVGYIEIDNPPVEEADRVTPIIRTLAYFISSCMSICKNQKRMERMLYTDSLTGARNRNAYNQVLAELENGAQGEVGVLYIDINDMKGTNDRFGHAYGDHLLAGLAGKLSGYFAEEEIFRIDGDEFVVICQDKSRIGFMDQVQAFVDDVEESQELTVSVGYQWSDRKTDMQELIAASDRMMYENKKGFYLNRSMPRHCRYQYDDVRELLNPVVLARKLEEGQFPVYLQPKMAVRDRRLIGAEALVRYRDGSGGIMSPDRFIPLLEEKHLIGMVDIHVYGSVCNQIASWTEMGMEVVPVSVNFSRYTLMEVGFVEQLERIATASGIKRELVEIEVTESADTDEGFDFFGIIEKIRKAGFTVSIDDFGVKYANLFLFAAAEFDVLKIDKSLSRDLVCNERAREVLRSISDICNRMGISMIVEGIESEDQLLVLEEMGCYGVQGYYFSRPIPVLEYESRYVSA